MAEKRGWEPTDIHRKRRENAWLLSLVAAMAKAIPPLRNPNHDTQGRYIDRLADSQATRERLLQ